MIQSTDLFTSRACAEVDSVKGGGFVNKVRSRIAILPVAISLLADARLMASSGHLGMALKGVVASVLTPIIGMIAPNKTVAILRALGLAAQVPVVDSLALNRPDHQKKSEPTETTSDPEAASEQSEAEAAPSALRGYWQSAYEGVAQLADDIWDDGQIITYGLIGVSVTVGAVAVCAAGAAVGNFIFNNFINYDVCGLHTDGTTVCFNRLDQLSVAFDANNQLYYYRGVAVNAGTLAVDIANVICLNIGRGACFLREDATFIGSLGGK